MVVEQTLPENAANRGAARSQGPTAQPSIARIAAWLARHSEVALGDIGLSLPQYRLLNLLAEGSALQSSLADRLNLRRPSITAVVDGLVSRDLVARQHDAGDRRRVTHSITPAGRRVLSSADAVVEARLRAVAACLGPDDLVTAALDGLARWGPALTQWRREKAAGAKTDS